MIPAMVYHCIVVLYRKERDVHVHVYPVYPCSLAIKVYIYNVFNKNILRAHSVNGGTVVRQRKCLFETIQITSSACQKTKKKWCNTNRSPAVLGVVPQPCAERDLGASVLLKYRTRIKGACMSIGTLYCLFSFI